MLSNRFPELTPAETDQFLRHQGYYIVSHYDETVRAYVASRLCSVAYAIDMAKLDNTEGLREYIRVGLIRDGCAILHDPQGRKVSIIDPNTYHFAEQD